MKQTKARSSGRLKMVFCLVLAVLLAAGIVMNGTAAAPDPVQYDVKIISADTHTVALYQDTLYYWGTNDMGQLPGFDGVYTAEPAQGPDGVADVAASLQRTLVVTKEGELRSYGKDPSSGYTDKGRVIAASDAVQAAASDTFAAYISKAGALYTWGINPVGQLGKDGQADTEKPVQIFDSGVSKVALGESFALALMEDGTVYGWGDNSSQQLGAASPSIVTAPVKITDSAQDIAAGYAHSCILKKDGSLWVCGSNMLHQLGLAEGDSAPLTQLLTGIRSVSAGWYHNFAVANDGTVYTWGYGRSGQLGSGTTERQMVPAETEFDYVQVFACRENTFGVAPNGVIYSFGTNTNYVLGKDNGSDSTSAERILDAEMNWIYGDRSFENGVDLVGPDGVLDESRANPATPARPAPQPAYEDTEPADPAAPLFADVPADSFFAKAVAWAVEHKITTGTGDGTTFSPKDACDRAQVVTFLYRAAGSPDVSGLENPFEDVKESDYFYEAVLWAVDKEITSGVDDAHFAPHEACDRAQAVTFLYRFSGSPEATGEIFFSDVLDTWYTKAVSWAVGLGITNGTKAPEKIDGVWQDGLFSPSQICDRSQIVTFLFRCMVPEESVQ